MLIEKSRSGVYQDTPENRRLHRVGQRYGEAKKPEEKAGDNVKNVKIATSRAGIKTFLSGKVGDDYYRAVAEAYNALRRSGKNKSVNLMLEESGSGNPSKDIPAKKYVEAVNNGATHDEAVAFADDCYEEFLAKIQNVQEKVYSEGVSTSAATKMFAAVSKWFNAQKFEKKAVSGSGVKKDETKLPSKLGDLEFNEDKPTGERWYEGEMGGQRVRILQETVGKDDWWVVEISGHNVVDDNNKAMTFDNVQDAFEAIKQAEKIDRGVRAAEKKRHLEEIKRTNEKINAAMKKQFITEKKSAEMVEKPTSRVTFADVPRSMEVNLKKYLTDSRRKQVDHLMKAAEVMPKSTVKQMHDEAVKKFNDNFDNLKKSERASALYVIMKYKDLLNKVR